MAEKEKRLGQENFVERILAFCRNFKDQLFDTFIEDLIFYW